MFLSNRFLFLAFISAGIMKSEGAVKQRHQSTRKHRATLHMANLWDDWPAPTTPADDTPGKYGSCLHATLLCGCVVKQQLLLPTLSSLLTTFTRHFYIVEEIVETPSITSTSSSPTITSAPAGSPTFTPTVTPTKAPTVTPTKAPTVTPTKAPTVTADEDAEDTDDDAESIAPATGSLAAGETAAIAISSVALMMVAVFIGRRRQKEAAHSKAPIQDTDSSKGGIDDRSESACESP
jgi:hypothetical protein